MERPVEGDADFYYLGNRRKLTQLDLNNGSESRSYAYNAEGQLERYNITDTQFTNRFNYDHKLIESNGYTYQYDGFGNRVSVEYQGRQNKFIYDMNGDVIASIGANEIEDRYAGSSTRYYIYGHGLIGMNNGYYSFGARNDDFYDFFFDGSGNVTSIVNTENENGIAYNYSTFGKVNSKKVVYGRTFHSWNGEVKEQPFKYAGRYGIMHEYGDIYYMRARYYDAEVGRFLKEDPAGLADGINVYSYVYGNPVNYVDPTGLGGQSATGSLDIYDPPLEPVCILCYLNPALRSIWELGVGKRSKSSKGNKEHTSGKSKSKLNKHQRGRTRNKRDGGGEKGDAYRPYQR